MQRSGTAIVLVHRLLSVIVKGERELVAINAATGIRCLTVTGLQAVVKGVVADVIPDVFHKPKKFFLFYPEE